MCHELAVLLTFTVSGGHHSHSSQQSLLKTFQDQGQLPSQTGTLYLTSMPTYGRTSETDAGVK